MSELFCSCRQSRGRVSREDRRNSLAVPFAGGESCKWHTSGTSPAFASLLKSLLLYRQWRYRNGGRKSLGGFVLQAQYAADSLQRRNFFQHLHQFRSLVKRFCLGSLRFGSYNGSEIDFTPVSSVRTEVNCELVGSKDRIEDAEHSEEAFSTYPPSRKTFEKVRRSSLYCARVAACFRRSDIPQPLSASCPLQPQLRRTPPVPS